MKKKISVMEHAAEILTALPKGIMLTAQADGKPNTMVIGWGTLGIEWGKPIFITYVRQTRYTHELLGKNPEFTINVPLGAVDKNVIAVCGSKSGRDMDKFAECGLTAEPSEKISVPGIREFPLTLECKVIYRRDQDTALMPEEVRDRMYTDGTVHTAFYGEIVDAYIIE